MKATIEMEIDTVTAVNPATGNREKAALISYNKTLNGSDTRDSDELFFLVFNPEDWMTESDEFTEDFVEEGLQDWASRLFMKANPEARVVTHAVHFDMYGIEMKGAAI